jgi:hypothetical protein
VKDWHIFNNFVDAFPGGTAPNAPSCIIGATAIAPDGTNGATKIVGAANTQQHSMTAAVVTGSTMNQGGFTLRVGVFAKAAEYTRIALKLGTSFELAHGPSGFSNECVTVFDLAGGQIGVPNTNTNNTGSISQVPGPVSIIPYGNGWYRCEMDCTFPQANFYWRPTQNISGAVAAGCLLDNSSGTNPASLIFAGDGTSGVYTWKSACLPPQAWALSGQKVFFDDFTSIATTIDLNNTKAPGFKWYVNNNWAQFGWQPSDGIIPSPSSIFHQGPSTVSIDAFETHIQAHLMSTVWSGTIGGPIVGQAFQLPFVFESRMSYLYKTATFLNLGSLMWTLGQGLLNNYNSAIGVNNTQSLEWDFGAGAGGLGADVVTSNQFNWYYPFIQVKAGLTLLMGNGYPVWGNGVGYGSASGFATAGADHVFDPFDGNIYIANQFSVTVGVQPHTSSGPPHGATQWSPYTPNIARGWLANDFSQMHTYTAIMLLPAGPNDCGWALTFFDGSPSQGLLDFIGGFTCILRPDNGQTVGVPNWTIDQYPMIIFGGDTLGSTWDYVSVTQ